MPKAKAEQTLEVKVKYERPPVWDAVCAAFSINPIHAFFTYGPVIYSPSGNKPVDHIIAHEMVHMDQQERDVHVLDDKGIMTGEVTKMTPELWWGKFLRDPEFRLDQESEAYGVQYAYFCQRIADRNARARFLHALALSLSGPLYDKIINHQNAAKLIVKRSGMKS